MEGLLIQLVGGHHPTFWKLFGAIRSDLDRLIWCFDNPPWMGAPSDFSERDLLPFAGIAQWRPGTLARFADRFAEEYFDLWAIEPTRDDPSEMAVQFCASHSRGTFIEQTARVWLVYSDGMCWEIFARKSSLLDRVRADLKTRPWAQVYETGTGSEQRGRAFSMAGLSHLWRSQHGLH